MLIDSHAHIYDEEYDDCGGADGIISAMDGDRIGYIVAVGCDMQSSRQCAELAARNERIYATVGVHPYDADTVNDQALEELKKLAACDKVRAIGEIGLDFHRPGSDREGQMRAMDAQCELARELSLPVVFHLRDAYGEFCEFIKDRKFPNGAVIHCFSSSAEIAEQLIKRDGFYISFSGTLTYKNAVNLQRAAEAVPLERSLIETDSPYLTPEPYRGKRNFPRNVALVCEKLAEIKGVTVQEAEDATARNAMRIFGIK